MPFPQTAVGRGFGIRAEFDKHIESTSVGGPPSLGLVSDVDRQASGWPWPAMECRVVYGMRAPPPALVATRIGMNADGGPWLVDGVRAPAYLRAAAGRYLPLRPRALGFLGNTVLAGAVFWCAAFGWRDVRRLVRSRRGLCLRCGYPARGLERCPECGTCTASFLGVALARLVRVRSAWSCARRDSRESVAPGASSGVPLRTAAMLEGVV